MKLKTFFLHLRLKWQLILIPFFLWGFLLSEGTIGWKFWLGFFLFHIPFSGGSVAYNSYYDQDEGPICGLWTPPKADRSVLILSLAVQLAGLAVVWLINWPILIVSLVMFAMSTAYSHPATRLKAHPWTSVLTVAMGQGLGGALAGWFCGRGDWQGLLAWPIPLGLLMSMLVATGFYPLIQVFQRQEDRERGDITFAVRFGERSFLFAITCLVMAAVVGVVFLWNYAGPLDAVGIGAGLLLLIGLIYAWWRRFDEEKTRENYLWMMRLGYLMAGGFGAYIVWQLVWRLWA